MKKIATLFILLTAICAAKADEVHVQASQPRAFGYFVGDIIESSVEITAPEEMDLNLSSLPVTGPINIFLDIKRVQLREEYVQHKKKWFINLEYQNFYPAIDVHELKIPAFNVLIGDQRVKIPDWFITISPIRQIMTPINESSSNIIIDNIPAIYVEVEGDYYRLVLISLLMIMFFIVVAHDRAWPPFHCRKRRVFNALYNKFINQSKFQNDKMNLSDVYKRIHRAFDIANDGVLMREDLPVFINANPQFKAVELDIYNFFISSSRMFYDKNFDYIDINSQFLIIPFLKSLAKAERAS